MAENAGGGDLQGESTRRSSTSNQKKRQGSTSGWQAPAARKGGAKSTSPAPSGPPLRGPRRNTPSPSMKKGGYMNTPNRPQKKRKPKAKIDKDYKERVYKEWIQRRNALDLGRPITLGARAAADSETSEDESTASSEIVQDVTKISLPTITCGPVITCEDTTNEGTDSNDSFILDAADNASLLGRPTGTGALIRRLSRVDQTPPELPQLSLSKHVRSQFELTDEQIRAFREVFDLFDGNGGGTIDAEELDDTLRSVGICLEAHHIHEVMLSIDADGNGEIDFEEFLRLMTNTERFLDALTTDIPFTASNAQLNNTQESAPEEPGGSVRENMLFEALTEFMKKSALKGMGDIVDYYHTKYNRVQVAVPHVVNHYAAGARLIGLTEKQIKQHLMHLKATNARSKTDSPYAYPLAIAASGSSFQALNKAVKDKVQQKKEKVKGRQQRRGTIRLFVRMPSSMTVISSTQLATGKPRHYSMDVEKDAGWVGQRTEHIEARLPASHLTGLPPLDQLTAEDLPTIRRNMNVALGEYRRRRRRAQMLQNLAHWRELDVALISPEVLRNHFRVVFSHYSAVRQSLLTIRPPVLVRSPAV